MTPQEALAFVEEQGIVLESARGDAPSLAEMVAGEPVAGGWWSHPKGHEIFALTRALRASNQLLVCRLLQGKITFVHRRLWASLVRLSDTLGADRLARIHEVHTAAGRHEVTETPFPLWVPTDVMEEAKQVTEQEARDQLKGVLGPSSEV